MIDFFKNKEGSEVFEIVWVEVGKGLAGFGKCHQRLA